MLDLSILLQQQNYLMSKFTKFLLQIKEVRKYKLLKLLKNNFNLAILIIPYLDFRLAKQKQYLFHLKLN